MWNNVAIIRNEKGLKSAMARLFEIKEMLTDMKVPEGAGFNKNLLDALELQNMLIVAGLTVESALLRHESRGSHYREDYPETSDKWVKSIVLNKNKDFRYVKRGSTCRI
jgi:fumarate reductase (CoM/CoB) subunit A